MTPTIRRLMVAACLFLLLSFIAWRSVQPDAPNFAPVIVQSEKRTCSIPAIASNANPRTEEREASSHEEKRNNALLRLHCFAAFRSAPHIGSLVSLEREAERSHVATSDLLEHCGKTLTSVLETIAPLLETHDLAASRLAIEFAGATCGDVTPFEANRMCKKTPDGLKRGACLRKAAEPFLACAEQTLTEFGYDGRGIVSGMPAYVSSHLRTITSEARADGNWSSVVRELAELGADPLIGMFAADQLISNDGNVLMNEIVIPATASCEGDCNEIFTTWYSTASFYYRF